MVSDKPIYRDKHNKPEDCCEHAVRASHGAFLASIADAAVAVTEGRGRRLAVIQGSGEDVVKVLRLLDGKKVDHDACVVIVVVVVFPVGEVH